MSLFQHYRARYEEAKEEELSLVEYLELCKRDPSAYATAAERMLHGHRRTGA
jgi:serine protein kinase